MEIRYGGVINLITSINIFLDVPRILRKDDYKSKMGTLSMLLSKTSQNLQNESRPVSYFIISHIFRFGLLCSYSYHCFRWYATLENKTPADFQSCLLLTDRIEIHQLQPLVWPSNLLYVMLSGCNWWISIRSVNNSYTQDWREFWK